MNRLLRRSRCAWRTVPATAAGVLAGEPLSTERLGRQGVPELGDRVRNGISLLLRAAAGPDPEGQIPG